MTPFKITNPTMIPKEIAREFTQLSIKDSSPYSKRTSRSSSRSSSFSTPLERPLQSMSSQYDNEVAVIDDDAQGLDSPNLLASSIEGNGRLLPSLSTISLLSLNKEQEELQTKRNPHSRNTSFSHSRVTSFHHQRHPGFYFTQRRSSQQQLSQQLSQQQQQQISQSPRQLEQGIPIQRLSAPETPNFGPTSISGSPSNFYLGNQQLPASLQRQHGFPGLMRNNSYGTPGLSLNTASSPVINPVQGQDVPMTPLMLSNPLEDEPVLGRHT